MECCFAAGARACDMCIRLDINCRPHASQQGRGTDLLLSKGLSTITERKDGSSVEGDKVLASRQMRRIIPTVHDSSFQSEMDTLDIFCQGTRLIWFVDDGRGRYARCFLSMSLIWESCTLVQQFGYTVL